jgi:hypothetical protein
MPFPWDSNKTTELGVELRTLKSPFSDLGLKTELAAIAEITVGKTI